MKVWVNIHVFVREKKKKRERAAERRSGGEREVQVCAVCFLCCVCVIPPFSNKTFSQTQHHRGIYVCMCVRVWCVCERCEKDEDTKVDLNLFFNLSSLTH